MRNKFRNTARFVAFAIVTLSAIVFTGCPAASWLGLGADAFIEEIQTTIR